MIKYCLNKWEKNSAILEHALRTETGLNKCNYKKLVEMVTIFILNDGTDENNYISERWNADKITEIDNGDCQGTLIYLIPADSYQPCEHEYLMTYVGYGSCSGCDTLQAIQSWGDKLLTDEQVKDFMTLCRDIVSNIIKPYNTGWRESKDYEAVEG